MNGTTVALFCRLCAELQSENHLININDQKSISLNLAYKIYHCFLVKITEDDNLPKHICAICCEKVISSYEFHEQVQRAQEILKNKIIEVKQEIFEGGNLNNAVTINDIKDELDNNSNFETKFEHSDDEDEDEKPLIQRQRKYEIQKRLSKVRKSKNKRFSKSRKLTKNYGRSNYLWKCIECDFESFYVKDLRNHYSEVHRKSTQYACVECPQIYDSYERFKSHMRIHSKKYICILCGKNCFHRTHLEDHMLKHSDSTPFQCSSCEKAFKTERSLANHKRSHLPNEIKYKYECEICQKKFTTKTILLCHKQNHTTGPKNYICDQCGRHFRQKTNLIQHTATHLDVAPFHCEQCPKMFKNIYRLRKHQKSHTDGKIHKCNECHRAFREKRALTRHEKIHTGELPFECEFCKKRFRLKSFLKIHLRQHTGERPYSCLECNHHFANSSNFIKHMKGRHGMNHFSVAEHHQFKLESIKLNPVL